MEKKKIQLFAFGLVVMLLLVGLVGCIRPPEPLNDTTASEKEILPELPTLPPAELPTERPTEPPTERPIEPPTERPTEPPTEPPTERPTEPPTERPTEPPTEPPTERPTEPPTEPPTERPTEPPTEPPTERPTEPPTEPPTDEPTTEPPVDPPVTPPDGDDKIKIYIDQGHNPHTVNTGAEGNGLREQDITYKVGILLAELLRADGRFEICLSRPTEETVLGTTQSESLAARADGANEWGADYFISIHVNAFTTDTANGIEAFAVSKEVEGYPLGEKIVNSLVEITGLTKRAMKVHQDLYVLNNTNMPAVLVELGFITNPTDAALMSNSPELFAKGIYDGITEYFNQTM